MKDFSAAAHIWTESLCKTDSDGDGRTNGEELGDPRCEWNIGDRPAGSASGHPGKHFCYDRFLFKVIIFVKFEFLEISFYTHFTLMLNEQNVFVVVCYNITFLYACLQSAYRGNSSHKGR